MADLIDTSTTIPGSAGGQVAGGRVAELPEEQRRAGADGEGGAGDGDYFLWRIGKG